LDCGAYKLILDGSLSATDDSEYPHIIELQKLKDNINSYTANYDPINTTDYSLSFKGFVIGKTGTINFVLGDNTGVHVDMSVPFGTSRIRNPASVQTDLIAAGKADYITQVQPLDMTANRNITGLSQQNRTTLCPCTTVPNLPRKLNCRL
jgi:hypothetical protein